MSNNVQLKLKVFPPQTTRFSFFKITIYIYFQRLARLPRATSAGEDGRVEESGPQSRQGPQ